MERSPAQRTAALAAAKTVKFKQQVGYFEDLAIDVARHKNLALHIVLSYSSRELLGLL